MFKIGDKVKYIRDNSMYLKNNKEYVIESINEDGFLKIKDIPHLGYPSRIFVLVEERNHFEEGLFEL